MALTPDLLGAIQAMGAWIKGSATQQTPSRGGQGSVSDLDGGVQEVSGSNPLSSMACVGLFEDEQWEATTLLFQPCRPHRRGALEKRQAPGAS